MLQAPVLTPEKIEELRANARRQLLPIIDNDYVVLDLPYYDNPGDILIWEGTLNLLKEVPHINIYSASKDSYKPPRLKRENVILLQGGGNFGDLWPEHQAFRKRIIEEFPANPVIVLPQSVHYQDEANLREDAEFFSRHPGVVICVRDRRSKQILEKAGFPNRILLVPDMAFFLDAEGLRGLTGGAGAPTGRVLFASRLDKEAPKGVDLGALPPEAEKHDWPTIEKFPETLYKELDRRRKRCRRLRKWTGLGDERKVVDRFYRDEVRPHHLASAVGFVDGYDEVWSTRLHIALLAMILGKRVMVLDNNYNKTRNLLETWF